MDGRVKTGIKGFDELVQGGLPAGFTVLVTGTPGTGKTLFTLEYLYNGASKFRERSMYVTFEQNLDDIRKQAKLVGLDLKKFESNGLLTLIYIPIVELNAETIGRIKKEAIKRKVKRLVIDSLSTLSINAPIYSPIKDLALRDIMNYKAFFSPPILGEFVVKRFIYSFIDELKQIGCTTLIISESPEKGDYLSRDTVSEFLSDGVLLLTFESMGGEFPRSLLIRKMRGTKHSVDIHPIEVGTKGLVIHNVK